MRAFLFVLLFTTVYAYSANIDSKDSLKTIIQTGHNATITSFSVSSDGHYAATLDQNGQVCIWDVKTGMLITRKHFLFSNIENKFSDLHHSDNRTTKIDFHKYYSNWLVFNNQKFGHVVDLSSMSRIGLIPAKNNRTIQSEKKFSLKIEDKVYTITNKDDNEIISVIKNYSHQFNDLLIFNNGKNILVNGKDIAVCWDIENARVKYTIELENNTMPFILSKDESYFITSEEKGICYRKSSDGTLIKTIEYPNPDDTHANTGDLDDNGNLLIGTNKHLYHLPIGTDKLILIEHSIEGWKTHKYTKIAYDKYMNRFLFYFDSFSGDIYTLNSNFKYQRFLNPNCTIYDIEIEKDNIYACGDYSHIINDEREKHTFSKFKSENIDGMYINNSCCYIGNDRLAVGNDRGILFVMNQKTNKDIVNYSEHQGAIRDIKRSPDGKFFYSVSIDGTMIMWDVRTLELIAKFVYFPQEDNYVIVTKDNYYTSSKNAFNGIHFSQGMQIFGFNQFDAHYNRPDIVLEHLGYASPYRLNMWKQVSALRKERLGYTQKNNVFNNTLPEISIVNIDDIAYEQKDGKLELELRMQGKSFSIDHIIIKINDVPFGGINGIPVTDKNNHSISQNITIDLDQGENIVEVSCMNEMGVESYQQILHIKNTKETVLPDMYLFCIGVSNYLQNEYNLKYASKDANDFANAICKVNKKKYSNIYRKILTDDNVTKNNISKIGEWLSKAKASDVVIVFYAGHGLLDDKYDQYLATYDMDFSNPIAKGLPYHLLDNLLAQTKALKKIMFIDACHSGILDKAWVAGTESVTKVKANDIQFRSNSETKIIERLNYEDLLRIYDETFRNFQSNSGSTIFASASGIEEAIESKTWKNGLFTSVVIDAILRKKADTNHDKKINISEAKKYIISEVRKRSNGIQEPTMRSENKYQNFILSY